MKLPPFGLKHVSDLEFFHKLEYWPACWVRLLDEEAHREDVASEEDLLYTLPKAQDQYRGFILKLGATTTKKGINGKKTSTYIASDKMVFPFLSKTLKAVNKNWKEKKDKRPALKEYEVVSLLIPNDFDNWKECDNTFRPGKFEANCGAEQLGENFPSLPDKLLKQELRQEPN